MKYIFEHYLGLYDDVYIIANNPEIALKALQKWYYWADEYLLKP